MTSHSVYGLILAGGFGTRLWPLSRKNRPKPFLKLFEDATLFSQTFERLRSFLPIEQIFVSSGSKMQKLIRECESGIPVENLIIEPFSRNTAPAIGLAAIRMLKRDPEAVMIVLPSDQSIKPLEVFIQAIFEATEYVQKNSGSLLTFGIQPTFASTGYGYIKAAERTFGSCCEKEYNFNRTNPKENSNESSRMKNSFDSKRRQNILNVEAFYEKPTLEKANDYLKSGHYYWNAGIFVWKAQTIFDLLCRFEPEMGLRLQNIREMLDESGQIFEDLIDSFRSEFSLIKNISIDYAVLEKATQVVVLPVDFYWDDLGTFQALDRFSEDKKDQNGNYVQGIKLVALNSSNNIILGQEQISKNKPLLESSFNPDSNQEIKSNEKQIALMGVHDFIVVQTPDLTLIVPKKDEKQIKELLALYREKNLEDYL